MKYFFATALAAFSLFACKTETSPTAVTGNSSDTSIKYAYTIDHPADNWAPGDLHHVSTVLNCLKAYETNDIVTCMKNFGDTVKLSLDGFEGKFSNDSLKAIFTASRDSLASMKINMDDWESVISKDKKTEFVSLWYKQIWTDKMGKTDSLEVMDDTKISNGKIVSLNEKIRHFAVKK